MRIEIPQELKDIMRLSNHPGHMIWNENKKEKLQNIMLSEEVKHKLDSLFYPDKTANCSVDINKLVLVIFHKSCKIQARIFYSQKNKENMQIKTQSEGKSGINNESCYALKRNVRFWASLQVQYPADPLIRHTFFFQKYINSI